eukprot:986-Heterococcus_DN1.PRE.1
MVEYLHSEGAPLNRWGEGLCTAAVERDQLEVLQWLALHDSPMHEIEHIAVLCSRFDSLRILQHLFANFAEHIMEDIPTYLLHSAGVYGHLRIVQWLREQGAVWPEVLRSESGHQWGGETSSLGIVAERFLIKSSAAAAAAEQHSSILFSSNSSAAKVLVAGRSVSSAPRRASDSGCSIDSSSSSCKSAVAAAAVVVYPISSGSKCGFSSAASAAALLIESDVSSTAVYTSSSGTAYVTHSTNVDNAQIDCL